MQLYDQMRQASQHENMKKLLHLLSITEGSSVFSNPYLAKGGSSRELWNSYANHPYFIDPNAAKWKFKWKDGREDYSTAHGRYMVRQATWKGANGALGGKLTFSPQDQDVVATWLVKNRGALPDVMAGNWSKVFPKLGAEWASLPTSPYAQHKFGDKGFIKALEKVGIDPKLAGYTGQFNVSNSPTPNLHTAPVGGQDMQTTAWQHQPSNQPVNQQPDVLSKQPSSAGSMGSDTLAAMGGNPFGQEFNRSLNDYFQYHRRKYGNGIADLNQF